MRGLLKLVLIIALVVAGFVWWTNRDDASGTTRRSDQQQDSRDAGSRGGGDRASQQYISSVAIWREPEGTVYGVRPTRFGRLANRDELEIAWRQAVRKGVPDSASLKDQFLCHPLSFVARAKPTWDLEDWRPDIGLTRVMLNACNPD